jgi:hypothetical protein
MFSSSVLLGKEVTNSKLVEMGFEQLHQDTNRIALIVLSPLKQIRFLILCILHKN